MAEEPIFENLPGEEYEDNRSRLAIFLGVLGRKFSRLILVNLMFMVFNIPAIILSYYISVYMVALFVPGANTMSMEDFRILVLDSGFPTAMFFMAVPVITFGPAQAGLTYLLRCYSYERPTFTWSDFKDKMKENMRQGIIVSVINISVFIFLLIDLYLYPRVSNGNALFSVANGLMVIVFVLFIMACMYLYPMMVTYELRIRDLYKNAVIFALARFVPNLAVLFLCFLVTVGPTLLFYVAPSGIILVITYLLYITLGFTLPGLIINFMVNPAMDKHLNRGMNQ